MAAARTVHNVTSSDVIWVVLFVFFLHFLFVFFLHFECNVEAVGIFEGGIVVVDKLTIFEESKVLDSKDFVSSFFLLWDFDVPA